MKNYRVLPLGPYARLADLVPRVKQPPSRPRREPLAVVLARLKARWDRPA